MKIRTYCKKLLQQSKVQSLARNQDRLIIKIYKQNFSTKQPIQYKVAVKISRQRLSELINVFTCVLQ